MSYLEDLATRVAEQAKLEFDRLSSGWTIGTEGWRRSLAREYRHRSLVPGLETIELREMKEEHWREALCRCLLDEGKSVDDPANTSIGASWKIAIAAQLRQEGIPYRWMTDALHMGAVNTIRAHVFFRERRTP